jgi:serine protease Do
VTRRRAVAASRKAIARFLDCCRRAAAFGQLRVALVLLCLHLGCDRFRDGGKEMVPSAAPTAAVSIMPTPSVAMSAPLGGFSDLVERVDSAVVFVETLQAYRVGQKRSLGRGVGSGFAFDAGGLILTNNHVIDGATQISVLFKDQRYKRAEVVGVDAQTDLAVLRVDGTGLPYIPLGDSDRLRVGDWVLAIGNPFGLSHTVSAGIISAKGRTRTDVKGLDPTGYYDFLQTDASINPGNSGGPLLDMAGTVVGINTAIKSDANSIGFAIPINMVKELLPSLLKDGKARRSAVGVIVDGVEAEDVERLSLPNANGAIVKRVVPGGPADRAGVRPDDVIVRFDGKEIVSKEILRWLASIAGVGRSVDVRLIRDKRTIDLRVTLGELPVPPRPVEAPEPSPFH